MDGHDEPPPARKTRILSRDDQQATRDREWAQWRGEVSALLRTVTEKLSEHVKEDKEMFASIREQVRKNADDAAEAISDTWTEINKERELTRALDGRITFYIGGGSAMMVLLNLLIGAAAAYAAFK